MEQLYDLGLADNGKGILFTGLSPIQGHGLFTAMDLPENTILCRRLGLKSELSPRDKRAIVGISDLDPGIPEDIVFKSVNHSCQPNTRLSDTGCLVSNRQIASGEEITIDYGRLLVGSSWSMLCLCGLPDCRKIIRAGADETGDQ